MRLWQVIVFRIADLYRGWSRYVFVDSGTWRLFDEWMELSPVTEATGVNFSAYSPRHRC